MKNIITAIENLKAACAEARKASGLIEITLPGSGHRQVMEEHGARLLREGVDVWCNSSTCNHSSHDSGEDWIAWLVPASWAIGREDEARISELFELRKGMAHERPRLLIPGDDPILLFESKADHWAASTHHVRLSEVSWQVVEMCS